MAKEGLRHNKRLSGPSLSERQSLDRLTYLYDYSLLHEDDYRKKRGLSKDLICIVVAIDIHKNTYACICGYGKPSAYRVYKALKDHIVKGSTIVHDGEKAHNRLIEKLSLKSEVYKADKNFFIGMKIENLQSYLNRFIYLFRVKGNTDRWPKNDRILRHLVLTDVQYKRKPSK